MGKIRISLIWITICLFLNSLSGISQDTGSLTGEKSKIPMSWGFETDFNTKYLWRGISYNDGLVIQPYLWASYGNLSGGLWSNITAYDRLDSIKRNELDLILTYSWTCGNFEIENTVMFYHYFAQEDSPPTGELNMNISYPFGDFSLVSGVTADFLTYFGSLYFEHGVVYERALGDKLNLASSALLGWGNGMFNSTYIGTAKTSLNLLSINVDLTCTPRGAVYFKPHIQISRTLDTGLIPYLGKYPWFCGILVGIEI